jgi:hypothetical protein
MEVIIGLFDWFWSLKMDVLIAPWLHSNMIPIAVVLAILRWWVKRTPGKADDELIDSIMSVLPMIKRKP